MVDKSLTFDLKRVMISSTNNFYYNLNRKFDLVECDGNSKNFEVVLCSACPSSINECVDNEGNLNTDVCTVIDIGESGLIALKYDYNNKGIQISMPLDTLLYESEDESINIKALFLRNVVTGYVLAYSILDNVIPLGSMMIPMGGILLNLHDE